MFCTGDERDMESVSTLSGGQAGEPGRLSHTSPVKLHLSLHIDQFVGIDDFVKVYDMFFSHLTGDNCQQRLFAPDENSQFTVDPTQGTRKKRKKRCSGPPSIFSEEMLP